MSPTRSRQDGVFLATLADQAERYDDMVAEMCQVVVNSGDQELTTEERNLLAVAYKNVAGARRAAWRNIARIEQLEAIAGGREQAERAARYKVVLQGGLSEICDAVLHLLDTYLLPNTLTAESKVFYLKMKGDYHRYLAEFKVGEELKDNAAAALAAYRAAQDIAQEHISSTHPVRLGLALNLSVLYYEILHSPERACRLAQETFETAIADLDEDGDTYRDSTLILQLLRDNLSLWSSQPWHDEAVVHAG